MVGNFRRKKLLYFSLLSVTACALGMAILGYFDVYGLQVTTIAIAWVYRKFFCNSQILTNNFSIFQKNILDSSCKSRCDAAPASDDKRVCQSKIHRTNSRIGKLCGLAIRIYFTLPLPDTSRKLGQWCVFHLCWMLNFSNSFHQI